MELALLSALNAERAARRACVVVTDMASGDARLVPEAAAAHDVLSALLAEALRSGKSGMAEVDGKKLFLTVHVPPIRLLVVGAVHISQALAPMARALGFDMAVVDPRTAFASLERFPDVTLIAEWPDVALPPLGADRYTAFVALTHDPKIDDPALAHALARDCFYVGALGSRKTHAKRVERLMSLGFDADQIARIRAPIGLNIGAVSPAEIALSIVGEIVATLRADRVTAKARQQRGLEERAVEEAAAGDRVRA
jgi:xanthine dehydrogenase accessory factor